MRCPKCDLYHPHNRFHTCISCGTSLVGMSSDPEDTIPPQDLDSEAQVFIREGEGDNEDNDVVAPGSKRRSKNLKIQTQHGIPTSVGIMTALLIVLIFAGATFFFFTKPKDYDRLLDKGRGELGRGQYAFAVETLKKAITSSPKDPHAYLLLARAYIGIDKEKEAMDAISKAQQLGQGVVAEPSLASDMANYYRLRRQYEKAINLLRPLAQKDIPGKKAELADLDALWGDEALRNSDFDTALTCWEEVKNLGTGSRFSEAEARLATIYEKLAEKLASGGKESEALGYLGKLTNISRNPKHFERAADIYAESGKLELAISQLREALKLGSSPNLERKLSTLLAKRGKELLDAGQSDTGYAYLQQARSIDPSSALPEVTLRHVVLTGGAAPKISGEVWNPRPNKVSALAIKAELYDLVEGNVIWAKETKVVDEFVPPLGEHQSRHFEFVSAIKPPNLSNCEFKIYLDGALYKAYPMDKTKQSKETAKGDTTSGGDSKTASDKDKSTQEAETPGKTDAAVDPIMGEDKKAGESTEEKTLKDLDF